MKERNYYIEEIQICWCLRSIKACRILNYIEHLLILVSTVSGCVFISALASFVGIPIRITSSAIGLKVCVITTGIKKYKSIIKKIKKKKKHDEIVLLAKSKLNSIEVSISKTLIYSNNANDEFVSGNNVLKEYDNMKEKIKSLKT